MKRILIILYIVGACAYLNVEKAYQLSDVCNNSADILQQNLCFKGKLSTFTILMEAK